MLLLVSGSVQAQSVLPSGGQVRAGSVTIGTPAGNNLSINQTSNRAVVDWKSFSIGQPNSVNITQPGSQAAILNRVTGNTTSTIAGQLNANGQVYLVNPNGIAITPSGAVKADGGFVASTLGISGRDFMRGNLSFKGNGASAPVTNQGSISTGPGGYTALLGGSVNNSGTINVPLGKVGLGSGERATLDLNGDGFLQVTAPTGAKTAQGEALVTNSGVINAPGGSVELKAATVATAIRDAVNMSGVISATSVTGQNGSVTLGGGPGGNVNVTGTVDVSGLKPGQTGGAAVVSGRAVNLGKTARIDARGNAGGGSVKVGGGPAGRDPSVQNAQTANIATGAAIDASATDKGKGGNIAIWSDTGTVIAGILRAEGGRNGGDGGFIETSGGDLKITATALVSAAAYQGTAGRWLLDPVDLIIDQNTATAIGTALTGGSNVSLATSASGNTVNPASLTPIVDQNGLGDIYVEAPISWAFAAGNQLSISAYNNIYVNAAITYGGASNLFLESNNAAARTGANIYVAAPILNTGTGSLNLLTNRVGVSPIFVMGLGSAQFPNQTGVLNINGANYTLLYDLSATAIGIQSINASPNGNYALGVPITNVASIGVSPVANFGGTFNGLGNSVSGLAITDNTNFSIGFFGTNSGTIQNFGLIGGSLNSALVGVNAGALVGINSGTIRNSFASMNVNVVASVNVGSAGGLVGFNSGSISGSYATGNVGSARSAGGLVGVNSGGVITDAYALGQIAAAPQASGGLAAGGLVGFQSGGSLSNVYATGTVTGCNISCGGLLGLNSGGGVNNGYWNTTTSGMAVGIGSGGGTATGLTTAQLAAGLPSGFSTAVWDNLSNRTTPYLYDNPGPVQIGTDASGKIYNIIFTPSQLQAINTNNPTNTNSTALASNYVLANDIDLTGVSSYIPIGETTAYTGTFDGLGHAVVNLTITSNSLLYAGLFGQVGSGGIVRNIGVFGGDITITGGDQIRIGGLVGLNMGTISDAYANVTIDASGTTNSGVGGLVGRNGNGAIAGTIQRSFATGSVTGDTNDNVGGLVGRNLLGQITDSYSTASVTGKSQSNNVGGFVGLNEATIARSYATGDVKSASAATGGFLGTNLGTVTASFYNTTINPTLPASGDNSNSGMTGVTTAELQDGTRLATLNGNGVIWDNLNGRVTPYLAKNPGSVLVGNDLTPSFLISTPEQLQNINANSTTLAGKYALARNIDVAELDFVPIGSGTTAFTGTFNGLGYVVENLTIEDYVHTSVGLFGTLSAGGTISNVGVIGGSIASAAPTNLANVGGLVGFNNGGTISNSYSTASIGDGAYVGGLVGFNFGTITNSYSTGSVSAAATTNNSFVGGLVGLNGASILYSYATGPVSGLGSFTSIGGLVGANAATIDVVYSAGSVQAGANPFIGGLVGINSGSVTNALFNMPRSGLTVGVGLGNNTEDITGLSATASFQTSSYANHGFNFTTSTASPTGNNWVRVGPLDSINESTSLDGTMPMLASEYSRLIQNGHQLQLVALALDANYTLGRNIDATGTGSSIGAATGTDVWSKQGFIPLGNFAGAPQYSGTFDGGGFAISNLTIKPDATADPNNGQFVGLFGVIGGTGIVRNVALLGGSVTGSLNGNGADVGSLAGRNDGQISNVYSTMAVKGYVGPLIGGAPANGGLVGENNNGASITSAYATGAVTGTGTNGGLVGFGSGTVTNGYYDAGTTGQPLGTAQGGSVGRTTGQLQQDLASLGFDPGVWSIIPGKTYPYFSTQFGGASPQVIAGTVYTGSGTGPASAGYVVTAAVNGTFLPGGVQTGANGYYYDLLSPNSVLAGDSALAYVNGTVNGVALAGATFLNQAVDGSRFNADIYGNNTLRIVTPSTTLSAAQSDLTANVNAIGANILVGGLSNLNITATGSSFSIDQQITSAAGTLTIAASGPVTQTAGGIISVDTLTGSSVGGLTLTQPSNAIAKFGPWTNTGGPNGISLATSQGLQITGGVSNGAGLVTLRTGNGGDLAVNATISAGTLDLESDGAITQSATITAGTLTGSAKAGLSFGTLSNTVGIFGPFSNTGSGGIAIRGSSDGMLSVTGAISNPGRPVSLDSANGSLSLSSTSNITSSAVSLQSSGSITQTAGGVIDPPSLLVIAAGSVSLTGNNDVDVLAASVSGSGSSFTFNNTARTLTIGTVVGVSGINTNNGAVTLTTTTSGDIVLNQAITSGSGAVVLASVDGFTNNVGSAAISSSTRWLIYSRAPALDVFGGAGIGSLNSNNTAIWNATLATLPVASVSQGGNRYLFAFQPTLTLTSTSLSKAYGVDNTAAVAGAVLITGLQPGVAGAFLADTAASVYSGTPSVTSTGSVATAGVAGSPYTVTVTAGSFTVLPGSRYNIVPSLVSTGQLTVDAASLQITANSFAKNYGTAITFAGTEFTTSGLLNGDTVNSVSLVSAGAAASANVGLSPYTITPSAAVGKGLDNYSIQYVDGRLTVNPAQLTVSGDKTYDGNGNFALGTLSIFGAQNAETVTLTSGSGAASSGNAGIYPGSPLSGLAISVQNGNQLAANYALPLTGTLSIGRAQIGIVGTKTYDGTADFGTAMLAATGAVAGETITVTGGSGTAVSPNVGTAFGSISGITLFVSGGLASNYALPDAGAFTITPATLTYTATPVSRTYGAVNPAFTGVVTGFVNSETQLGATTGTLSFDTAATANSGVGSYAIIGSGLSATNYTFVQAAGNATALTVTPATLTYTADPKSRTYGASNPVFTGTVSGFVNSDTVLNSTTGTLSFGSTATVLSGVGSYAITGSGLSATNYTFVQAPTNATALTITPATLTYTADAKSRIYGAANPAFTGTVTGFVNGEAQGTATTGTLLFGTTATPSSGVGSYAITGSGLSAANYTFAQAAGNATAFTITPATLTYTADPASRTYGAANPAFTGTVTGFIPGETQASATTGTLSFGSTATTTSGVGNYAITGSGLSAANYVFVQAAGNATALTITPATLTYTADPQSRTYGAANPAFTGTVSGFVNGETQGGATTGTLSFGSAATVFSGVGSYAITGSGLSAANYVFAQAPGNATALTVTPATLTYAADSRSRTYGATNPAFTGTVTGFVNGETQGGATTGTLSFGSTATLLSGVGSYAITGSGLSAANYIFAQAPGNATALTITPATLTYTADPASRTYGAANPAFTGTVTGFVNGETQGVATTGTLSFGSGATATSGIGSYPITGSGLSAANYVFAQAPTNATALTITPATLTYTADPKSRTYGAANPAFTGTLSGFVNGETQAGATNGTLSFGTIATPTSAVGSYAITGSGLSAANYIFVQAPPNATALTITPATLTYTADPVSRLYGAANPAFTGTVTGFVNGETQAIATTGILSFTSPATAISGVGSYPITGSGLSAINYTFVQAPGNPTALTVTPATLTYTADPASRLYGAANPAFTGTVTGFVNGESQAGATTGTASFTSAATATSGVGNYAITGSGLSAANYVFAQAPGNATALRIGPATLTYTADPVNRTYGAANPAFTGTVSGFVNGETQAAATTGTLFFGTAATATSGVGSYAILGSGLSAANYIFVQAPGNATALTITPATLTYVADAASRTYGAANPVFTGTVTGFVNAETRATATTGVLSFGTAATETSGVGSYAITGSGLSAANYVFVQAASNGTALTVTPATLTYNANPVSRLYGAANPALTGTVTGFVNGETQAGATNGVLSFDTVATAASSVGSYAITGSGLSAANYTFVQAARNSTALTIGPATLVYTADAASRLYGAANPAFTGTVTGFVNGDTQAGATTGTLSFGTLATPTSGVGSYAINGSGLTATNYTFVQAPGNATALSITPATLTYLATAASRTYGAENPGFAGTVTGFVNGETLATGTTGTLAFATPATALSGVGNYAITGSGLAAANYTFVQAPGNATALAITPATLTYSAKATAKTYGSASPTFDGSVLGFVNGENVASATTGTLAFTSPATTTSGVGSYAIVGSGLSAANYTFVQAPANATALTVVPATLIYTATAASRTYGAANPAFTGTVSGFVNADTQGSATTGTLAFTSPATALSGVGAYAITGSGLSAANYTFVQAPGNSTAFTVTPATLTYIASPTSRTYGAANPAFTGTVSGFVNGEVQATATTGTLAFASPATATSDVGSYAITGSGLSAANYTFVQAAANATAFTITPASLAYVAVPASRIYGAANPALTGSVSGFVNGDTQATATTGVLGFATAATATTGVGNYAIAGSGLSARNYVFVQAPANATAFTITPATLTYSATPVSRLYGAANPALTGTVTGFANGETVATATAGTLAFATPATVTSGVGNYAITGSGLSAANYTFVQAPTNATALTVTPATLTYTSAAVSRTYGAANPVFAGTVTGFVNGETPATATTGTPVFASPATALSGVGSYAITGSGLSASNYVFAQAPSNATALTITPATLTYTADPKSRLYGAANPALTGTVSGFVNGETQAVATTGTLAFTTPATTVTPVGGYAITGTGLGAANYVFVQAPVNATALTVNPATLIYVAAGASRTYGTANPALGGTVAGFVNGETQATATTGTLSFTTPATVASNVGAYAISGAGLAAPNYVFVQAPGNATALTVTPAPLTITAADQSKVYGQTLLIGGPGTFSVSGLLNADTITGVTLTGTGGAATATVAGGPYTITPSAAVGTGIANYAITFNAGTLTVTPAPLTITASDQAKTYGQALALGTTAFTAAGLVAGDAVAGVTLSSPGAAAGAGVAGSPYAITPSAALGSGLTNYTISYVNGQLTVSPATITVALQGSVGRTFDGTTNANLNVGSPGTELEFAL